MSLVPTRRSRSVRSPSVPIEHRLSKRWTHRGTQGVNTGFSLVEVMMALVVSALGVMGLLGSMTAGAELQQDTQEYGQASRAARQVRENMRNGELDTRVAEYKNNGTFEVGPITVEVRFPEQVLVDMLGGPIPAGWRYRDLDGDGEVELDPAPTAEASLVPVSVVTSWNSGQMTTSFLVTER